LNSLQRNKSCTVSGKR